MKKLIKILSLLAVGFFAPSSFAEDFDRTVLEPNLQPDTTAPAVTIFLDNLKPPRIRVRPSGITWISFPYEIRICESSLAFVTVESLKPKDSLDTAVAILSVNVDADKMNPKIKAKLAANEPIPPVNVNCLLASGQKKVAIFYLDFSADAVAWVKLEVKKKISQKDLGEGAAEEEEDEKPELRKNAADEFPTFAAMPKPKAYEVGYHKELVKYKPSELSRILGAGGKKNK